MDKNKEYKFGIKKVQKYTGKNKLILNYLHILTIILIRIILSWLNYIISKISRNSDKLFLCELHNNEFEKLKINLKKFTNSKILKLNGFDFINKFDLNKNNLILIDPAYEIKEDYDYVINILNKLDKNFQNSKIIIWYPILSFKENDLFIEN